jgi:hypothetical protein
MKASYYQTMILAVIAPLWVLSAAAEPSTYILPVTRDAKTTTRVAFKSWSGEYPLPVIDVASQKKGTTTIRAQKSVRKLDEPISCTIDNGIYHPWSKGKGSLLWFYTLLPLQEYATVSDGFLGEQPVKKDDLVSELVYIAEGTCGAMIKRGKKTLASADFLCTELEDITSFKHTTGNDKDTFREQWIYVQCKEGDKAFILDTGLLKETGVREGRVMEYGKVGPAAP